MSQRLFSTIRVKWRSYSFSAVSAVKPEKTIFLSTHDVELALQLADTVWLMTRETGVSIGSPKELAQQGILGSFIEREDIAFDPETLAIKILRNN